MFAADRSRHDEGRSDAGPGKNPASVRRLFTAPANPDLRTTVAMADALHADVVIVPRPRRNKPPGRTSAAA
jgi:hypothetical protein